MTPEQLKKAERIKQAFRDRGQTISEFARANGWTPHAVYRVLNGFDKANYGKAHDIAVKLGMKEGGNLMPSDQERRHSAGRRVLDDATAAA